MRRLLNKARVYVIILLVSDIYNMANISGLGLKALKMIIDEKRSAHSVAESFNQEFNLSNDEVILLKKTVNGSLKHFYLLKFQAMQAYPDFNEDDDEIYLLIVSLFQLRYCQKTIAGFRVIEDACDTSEFMSLRFDKDQLKDKLEKVSSTPFKIPEEMKNDPYKFNSLFFSVPEWIIKMWASQYGDEIAMALLKDTLKKHPVYVKVNHKLGNEEEILSKGDFERSENNMSLAYTKSTSLSLSPEFKQGKVFMEDISTQLALEKLELKPGSRVIQLHGSTGSVASDISLRFKDRFSLIEVNYNTELSYRRARYQFQRLKIDNAKAYLGNKDILLTYCEFGKYDLAISSPSCSYLGQISKRPSLLATLRKKDLLGIISHEKESLEFASKYLNKEGTLIYLVPTINKGESENIISDFLKEHKEFTLVSSKQIFPYDYSSDGLFFARMVKGQ